MIILNLLKNIADILTHNYEGGIIPLKAKKEYLSNNSKAKIEDKILIISDKSQLRKGTKSYIEKIQYSPNGFTTFYVGGVWIRANEFNLMVERNA